MIFLLSAIGIWSVVDEYAEGKIVSCKQTAPPPSYRPDDADPPLSGIVRQRPKIQSLKPTYKELNCEQPNSTKEYELCQSWRSANASQEQACIAGRQLWLGFLAAYVSFFALIGLAGSIYYAGRQAGVLIYNERPWVGIQTVASEPLIPTMKIVARVVLKNSGRTPAFRMRAVFKGHILRKGVPTPPLPGMDQLPEKALLPSVLDYYRPFDGWSPLSQKQFNGLKSGRSVAWIVGRVEYFDERLRGKNGEPFHTDVRTWWDPSIDAFIPDDTGNETT